MNGNPKNFYNNDCIAAIKRMQKEKYVHISDQTVIRMNLIQEGACDVTVSKQKFFKTSFAFPVSKDFPYTDVFNKG